MYKKAASTVTNAKQLFKCNDNQEIVFLLLLGYFLQKILIILLLSSLKVANATRAVKKKTEDAVWIEVSWEKVWQYFC